MKAGKRLDEGWMKAGKSLGRGWMNEIR